MKHILIRFGLSLGIVLGAGYLLEGGYPSSVHKAQATDNAPSAVDASVMFQKGLIRILTDEGQHHDFLVELAITPAQQRRGLMFRKSLASGHGMLFDYHPPRQIAMWMKNTYISLDMLFFDAKGQLVYIASRTTPFSEKLIAPPTAVRYVLEVPAGTAEQLKLKPGSRLQLR